MKKAIISTLLILGVISAALFAFVYFKGSQSDTKKPSDKAPQTNINKTEDDFYLPSTTDKKTSDELLHSMDDVEVQMKDSYPRNYSNKYENQSDYYSDTDYYPENDYSEDAYEDESSYNQNATSDNSSSDSEAAYFDLNANSKGSGERYEVSREKYEECGYDSNYYIVEYSDGTREIVEGDN